MSKNLREYENDVRKDLREQVLDLKAVMNRPEFNQIKDSLTSVDHFDKDPTALGIWIANEAVRRKRIDVIISE